MAKSWKLNSKIYKKQPLTIISLMHVESNKRSSNRFDVVGMGIFLLKQETINRGINSYFSTIFQLGLVKPAFFRYLQKNYLIKCSNY